MYPYGIEWLLSGHWMYVARLTVYQSSGNVSAPPNPLIWNLYFFWPQSQMKRGYPVSKGILVQMRLFIHVFRILFTIIHSNTYLEKGHKKLNYTVPSAFQGGVVMVCDFEDVTCLARNFVCHKIRYYRNLLTANYLNIVLLFSFCQILQLRLNQNRQVSAETCRF